MRSARQAGSCILFRRLLLLFLTSLVDDETGTIQLIHRPVMYEAKKKKKDTASKMFGTHTLNEWKRVRKQTQARTLYSVAGSYENEVFNISFTLLSLKWS